HASPASSPATDPDECLDGSLRLASRLDRAKRGGSGALHPQSALAGPNPRPRGWASGPVRRWKASMARSRAVSAREPGQIREEAALSDTAHAPRVSLTGANRRRERPGTFFDGGCTVHYASQPP